MEETKETQSKVEKEISKAKQERQENESALTQTQTATSQAKQELKQTQAAISQAKQELTQTQTALSQAKQELKQTQTAISQAKTASQTASAIQTETSNIIVGDIEVPTGFKYLGSTKHTCGRLSNTMKEYKHTQTGLEFVLIPGGTFQMGSNDGDEDEKPIHKVTLSAYFISKTTVTQGVWQKVMGTNPSYFKGDNHPVERVSWKDCQEFCQKTGLALPTEAQWEYAARGGSSGKWCCGDDESELKKYAWYGEDFSGSHHEVGKKSPNAYGLYDMHGNVWEWCGDNKRTYQNRHEHNPLGGNNLQASFVYRGGSWRSNAHVVRCARRGSDGAGYSNGNLGFRVFSPVF